MFQSAPLTKNSAPIFYFTLIVHWVIYTLNKTFPYLPETSLLGLKAPTSKGKGEGGKGEEGIKEMRRREREKGEEKGEK